MIQSFKKFLNEVFISPNNGSKYGQVIFLVGGAASGKSTAIAKYIDDSSYKIVNPDDVKILVSKAADKGIKGFEDMKGIDINTPSGSKKMHDFIYQNKLSSKKSKLITADPSRSVLPNLLFDRTFAWAGEFSKISRSLIRYGYKARDIHVIFVFTDINIALDANRNRKRTLPDDVIVSTSKGAKARFLELFFGRAKGAPANGDYYIIVNHGDKVIKVKSAGKRIDKAGLIARKVASILQ
tara:strand:- start:465 stop:1181 length:717 start_codon:yes stop_codon:yes gene_type:complete